jgi:two-component system cell cycle sensor histidine kinase/response regulator CckA
VSVLLVEDQDAVRRFARLALESQGHEVNTAESGEGALDLATPDTHFDVLVTDVMMPGIDGRELAVQLRAHRPDLGVVLMSGYAPDTDRIEPVERSVFLPKPFPPADLFAALDKALRLVGRASVLAPGGSSVTELARM